jgi:hypothetical protein
MGSMKATLSSVSEAAHPLAYVRQLMAILFGCLRKLLLSARKIAQRFHLGGESTRFLSSLTIHDLVDCKS